MGIQAIQAVEVTCQQCSAVVVFRKWLDAEDRGWARAINGGHSHLCPQCAKKQPKKMSTADWITELKCASPEELLRAAQKHYALINYLGPAHLLRQGFKIARLEDGWKQVAPSWLRDLRAQESGKSV